MDTKKIFILAALGVAAFVVTRKANAQTLVMRPTAGAPGATSAVPISGVSGLFGAVKSLFSGGQTITPQAATLDRSGNLIAPAGQPWSDPLTGENAIWGNADELAINPPDQYSWSDPLAGENALNW